VLDAFFLSHTSEAVDVPGQEATDGYLPSYHPKLYLDVNHPHAFGGMVSQDYYMEFRYKMQLAMNEALKVVVKEDENYRETFGRGYGLIERYPDTDAELVLVTSGTVTSTARAVIDDLRAKGKSVGLLKVRLFRPFPVQQIREALGSAKKVAVLDRNICVGMGGIFAQEIRAALYQQPARKRPPVLDYIVGLGGRDVTPAVIEDIAIDAMKRKANGGYMVWKGLKD